MPVRRDALIVPARRGTLVVPAEVKWMIQHYRRTRQARPSEAQSMATGRKGAIRSWETRMNCYIMAVRAFE
jgi:hypothetical protein